MKSDLCFVKECIHNNGLGTCYIENGLPYMTLEDIEDKNDKEKIFTKCEKFEMEMVD